MVCPLVLAEALRRRGEARPVAHRANGARKINGAVETSGTASKYSRAGVDTHLRAEVIDRRTEVDAAVMAVVERHVRRLRSEEAKADEERRHRAALQ